MRSRKNPYEKRAARLEQFGYASYSDYLHSNHWADLKRRFYASKLYHGSCEVCFKSVPLEIHHKTYKRLGAEHLGDLIAVCRDCHQATHDRHHTDPRTTLWKAHRKLRKQHLRAIGIKPQHAQSRKAKMRVARVAFVRSGNFLQSSDGRLIYSPAAARPAVNGPALAVR